MKQYNNLSMNYQKLVYATLRKNSLNLFIGFIAFSIAVFFASASLLQNPYVFQKPKLGKKALSVQNISPSSGSTLQYATESGEISSISTNKVSNNTTTYVIKEGDYLWKIAEECYGDGMMMHTIMKANKLKNLDDVTIGKVLKIPRK